MRQVAGTLERYFEFQRLNTNWKTEILAGITTFVTMAYIVFVNPSILKDAGMPVAAVFAAMSDSDWERLKLCGSHTCRWAFFDNSRNHSSRWCRMASCGNRQKARRFRQKAKAGA